MKLSVTTLYNSSETIQNFYKKITSSVKEITNAFEIVFVNDCSLDDSEIRIQGILSYYT
jgi:hypothetical protein